MKEQIQLEDRRWKAVGLAMSGTGFGGVPDYRWMVECLRTGISVGHTTEECYDMIFMT